MSGADIARPETETANAVSRPKRKVSVSVVVPIYNVAPYLKECLDSVAAQTLKDIEVICIDDGSTDGSGDIAAAYVEKDSRFRLVRQKNHGLSAARNKGIGLAKGEYIYFIDSDDWISADALEKLVTVANDKQLDQLIFSTEVFCDDDYKGETAERNKASKEAYYSVPESVAGRLLTGVELANLLLKENHFVVASWGRLFRLAHLKKTGIKFPVGLVHEDEYFSAVSLVNAESALLVNDKFYHRRLRHGSLTTSQELSQQRMANYLAVSKLLKDYAQTNFADGSREREVLLQRNTILCEYALRKLKNVPLYALSDEAKRQLANLDMAGFDYPVDLVYLWCDSADPAFRAKRDKCAAKFGLPLNGDSNGEARCRSNDELKYSLRSAELCVPWVRKIYICIDDDQTPPSWLNLANPKLRIVRNSEFVPQEFLPTFNSLSIEHFLWRIPDLAEHFLYANDDTMFGRVLAKDFFFAKDAKPYCRFRGLMPPVTATCSGYRKWLGNSAGLVRERYAELLDDVKTAMMRWPHHNIDAYVKSDLAKVYALYRESIEATLHNPFRAEDNIQRVLFEYYGIQSLGWHYRQVGGKNPETLEANSYWKLAVAANTGLMPSLFCFTDSDGLSDYERRHGMQLIADLLLSEPSSYEVKGEGSSNKAKTERARRREAAQKHLEHYCETNQRDNYSAASRNFIASLKAERMPAPETVKISVIIPVYNAEKYINDCIVSVLSNGMCHDLEIICIDDGSTDDSRELLECWERLAPNLKVVEQKNQGAGVARNAGLDMASGEYVLFLDADDRITPDDALLRAYEQANRDSLDMLLAASSTIDEDGQMLQPFVMLERKLVPHDPVFAPEALGAALFLVASPGPTGKLYRREFLEVNRLRFPPLKRTEEFPLVQLALSLSSKIGVFAQPFFERRLGVATSLESTKDETPLSFFEAEQCFRDSLRKRNLWDRFKAADCSVFVSHLAYALRSVQRYSSFRAIVAKYRQERQQWICWDDVAMPERRAKDVQLVKTIETDMDEDDQIALFVKLREATVKNASAVKLNRLKSELAESQKRKGELFTKLQEAQKSRGELFTKLQEAQKSRGELFTKLQEAQKSRGELFEKLQESQKSRGEMFTKLQEAQKSRGELFEKLQEAQKSRGELFTKLQEAQKARGELFTKLQEAQKSRGELFTKLQASQKSRGELFTKLQASQKSRGGLSTRLQELKKANENLRRKSVTQEDVINKYVKLINQLNDSTK